mmetsp:Transcript_21804/g.42511  ORF Transcript_21804/g.42511 Transcript_21804/m.42511 type:complete len:318 (-) Transcript_21804:263-1216(-)
MMAYSKAANRASLAHEATRSGVALMACREDDARSTSASSGQGDGEIDIHAISSDEEREIALKQSKVVQHRNVPASAPWRTGKQQHWHLQQQEQKQQKQCNDTSTKMEQLRAPPGLPPPATTVGVKSAPAALLAPAFSPPPGLPPPPGLIEPPPGLLFPEVKSVAVGVSNCKQGAIAAFEYSPQAFCRELANIMRELRLHKNPGLAVGQVRVCGVPQQRQAAEFADILTCVAEESRGPVRRTCMAFVGGLTKAFEKEECIKGLRMFFDEVYPDLCTEVLRLPNIVMTELMPTLKVVLEEGELSALKPSLFDAVGCHAA